MSFFKSSGPVDSVKGILKLNHLAGIALVNYHTAVLRQESEISVGDRELIAAFVSGLNACQYCHGVHSASAKASGVDEALIRSLLDDVETAPVEPRLKPMLYYVKQLTLAPSRMTQAMADAVIASGWSERALHDAVCVCALFNFMNRLVEGHGLQGSAALFEERGSLLAENGYEPLLRALESEG
jgi:uncharacterized peroxidase-related enzyme